MSKAGIQLPPEEKSTPYSIDYTAALRSRRRQVGPLPNHWPRQYRRQIIKRRRMTGVPLAVTSLSRPLRTAHIVSEIPEIPALRAMVGRPPKPNQRQNNVLLGRLVPQPNRVSYSGRHRHDPPAVKPQPLPLLWQRYPKKRSGHYKQCPPAVVRSTGQRKAREYPLLIHSFCNPEAGHISLAISGHLAPRYRSGKRPMCFPEGFGLVRLSTWPTPSSSAATMAA